MTEPAHARTLTGTEERAADPANQGSSEGACEECVEEESYLPFYTPLRSELLFLMHSIFCGRMSHFIFIKFKSLLAFFFFIHLLYVNPRIDFYTG